MRIVGYDLNGETHVAVREGELLSPLGPARYFWRDPYASLAQRETPTLELGSVRLVPPVDPAARVLCVGLNYAEHVDEGPFTTPDYPTLFGRWTASLAVSGTPCEIPIDESGLDWEAEVLVVVGRALAGADPSEAAEAVFGYAAFNDITARRAQKLTSQWTLGKNADNSGAMSEFVTLDEFGDIAGRKVIARVNGEVMQEGNTDQMIFDVGQILAFISRTLTLRPGDLVATGTPAGVGYARTPPRLLRGGDVVEVEVEGIGAVVTPIREGR